MNNVKDLNSEKVIQKFDAILARGLCAGVGDRDGQMCIEAAVCAALDLPHGDDPGCVSDAVRSFKITLNDSQWSSAEARAKGLRDLGIAQLGSLGVVDDVQFAQKLSEQIIRVLIPTLFRQVFANFPVDASACLRAADRCEAEGTEESVSAASSAARSAARSAAYSAARSAAYSAASDSFLELAAKLALKVLMELASPGIKWLGL